MNFRKDVKNVELLSPSLQFESEIQRIEYREDPLTGAQSRLNLGRAGRVRQAQREELDLSHAIGETSAGCFFCPGNLEKETPKFPPHLWPAGRIRRGECVVFPNLFPFAEYHAVGTLTERHFPELDEFTLEMLMDNLIASQEYITLVHQKDEGMKYPMWIWNHLPPSGASIVHPHVQIVLDRSPAPEVMKLLERSGEYFKKNGSNYWLDLMKEEKELGERYIGENDSMAVIASYAPRGNREVQLVFKEAENLLDLDEGQIKDFASAIVKVLSCYKEMGVNSFNLITYSAPVMDKCDYYRLSARIISRPTFQQFYTSDSGFMERFYDIWVIEAMPEEVAQAMKEWF